jgi:transposase-like protein
MAGQAQVVRTSEEQQAMAAGMPACPNCRGHNVRRSHSIRMRDSLMRLASYEPFRCRVCQYRFYKRIAWDNNGDQPEN